MDPRSGRYYCLLFLRTWNIVEKVVIFHCLFAQKIFVGVAKEESDNKKSFEVRLRCHAIVCERALVGANLLGWVFVQANGPVRDFFTIAYLTVWEIGEKQYTQIWSVNFLRLVLADWKNIFKLTNILCYTKY